MGEGGEKKGCRKDYVGLIQRGKRTLAFPFIDDLWLLCKDIESMKMNEMKWFEHYNCGRSALP